MHHVNEPEPLGLFAATALFGGTSLYLAGHAAFWRRAGGGIKSRRLGGATLLLALIPLGVAIPALASLGLTVAVTGAVVLIESVRYAEARSEVRRTAHPGSR